MTERNLRFMSWNSRGFKTKTEKVKSELEKKECDVVFLQETHADEALDVLEDYKSFYTTQTSNSAGVAILINTNIFEETGCTVVKDPAGCYIVLKCTLKGHLFTLVSVYNCHSNIKPLLELRSVLEKHAEGILLIGGDFNVALNPYLDRTSKRRNKDHSHLRPIVENFLTSFHLVDVWRRLHTTDRQYSYSYDLPIKSSENGKIVVKKVEEKSRLDYIFVPEESMQYIKNCEISSNESCSDHYPVVFEMNTPNEEHKKPKDVCLIQICTNKKKVPFLKSNNVERQHIIHKCWLNPETVTPHTSLMISVGEVEQAIQSLIVNNVERPDGLPLSSYKRYLHVLIQGLCVFYHNILEQPTNIPEDFNKNINVSETHIFNIDYLILATIMARWLYNHLQSHSADYTDGVNKNTVLFTFKRTLIRVKWSFLQHLLVKEQSEHRTEPPLMDRFKLTALHKMLINSHSGKNKLLFWGCPLTPVLMTLYLKHVAYELVEKVKDQKASIHISRENVIVRFSHEFNLNLLEEIKGKYTNVDCTTLEISEQPNEEMPPLEDLSLSENEE